jgi:hypothetical protein
MEEDPFAVLEAMTIAAYATDASRDVHSRRVSAAAARLAGAIAQARTRGLLGDDVMGERVRFDEPPAPALHLRKDGAFNSIEVPPRNKPPFPAQSGLRQADLGQQRRDARERARHLLRAARRSPARASTSTVGSSAGVEPREAAAGFVVLFGVAPEG